MMRGSQVEQSLPTVSPENAGESGQAYNLTDGGRAAASPCRHRARLVEATTSPLHSLIITVGRLRQD